MTATERPSLRGHLRSRRFALGVVAAVVLVGRLACAQPGGFPRGSHHG